MARERIKVIEMTEDDRDYIQFLMFEKDSYQNILSYILLEKNKGYEYSISNYEHFMNEYKEAHIKHQIAFSNLIKIYAPEYDGNDNYLANINFEQCIMEIFKIRENEE